MYDITRQETFNNIRKWLRYVDEVRDFPDFLSIFNLLKKHWVCLG